MQISSDVYIDYRLEPAEKIEPALMEAIERSMIAVIIFSKSYASSTWCLKELEKIIEWNESHGQMVIPIFYNVDSSHVHDPTAGIYAEAFARHEWNLKGNLVRRFRTAISKALLRLAFGLLWRAPERHEEHEEEVDQVQKWKNAMVKAANFKGWDSKVIRPDPVLVDVIVKDVLTKLMHISPGSSEGFVSIDSRIEQIKELLSLQANDICVFGIWGMGGIGKTSTAKVLFKQMMFQFQFDESCFLENIEEKFGKPGGLSSLREELLSQILGNVIPNIEHSSVLQQMLSLKKVLIVLDNLTDLEQLNTLLEGDTCWLGWLGSGSRIIITSRNREIVGKKGIFGDNVRVIDPYEVKRLSYADSFKLFGQSAFEQKHVTEDFWVLSDSFIKYAGGIPLALKVLGRHLLGRDKDSWERSLDNLENGPLKGIQSVLRLSYDELSRDGKNMFLDIARFLNGERVGIANRLFQFCDFSVDISYLIDKCLLTESLEGEVQMHNLLQEMGTEIERQKQLPDRVRLWNYKDIAKVFTSKKEWERVESISLELSKTKEVLHLDAKAFARIPNLKFLKFYASEEDADSKDQNKFKVIIPQQGLECFPDDLLYLYWHGFPLKSLPANFHPSNLLVLRLPHGNVEKLLEEDQGVEVSDKVEPYHSYDIIPSSSQATNLLNTNQTYYINMEKAPSTMRYLGQLCQLDLSNCRYIESLPSTAGLKFLEVINLRGCSNLVNFPDVSRSTKFLYLGHTAIKEVPLSISNLNLSYLALNGCRNLTNVPFNIFFSKSLQTCTLFCSSNVKTLTFLESIDCLLDELVSTITFLDLSFTDVQSLPASIKKLSNLRDLYFLSCKNLESVPELPATLGVICADACRSLETICNIQKFFNADFDLPTYQDFTFINCLKMDENTWHDSSPSIILKIKRMAMNSEVRPYFRIHYPGSEIPKSFASSNVGTSFKLLPRWNSSRFLGFALCAVTEPNCHYRDTTLHCRCHFQNINGDSFTIMCCSRCLMGLESNHVLIWYDYILWEQIEKRRQWFREDCDYTVSFEFFFLDGDLNEHRVAENCGVLPLQGDDDMMDQLETPLMRPNTGKIGSAYKRCYYDYCFSHQMENINSMQ